MICNTCKVDYPDEFFYRRKSRSNVNPDSKTVRLTHCKFCARIYTRRKRLEYLGKSQEEINSIISDIQYGLSHPELRKCRRCNNWKLNDNFTSTNAHGDSRKTQNTCNACDSKRKREWIQNNPDLQKISAGNWKKNNPEKLAIYNHNRRVQRGVGGLTSPQIKALKSFYCPTGLCMKCGKFSKLTIDHVIPLSRGGNNVASNVQFLCQSCNSRKHIKIEDYRPDMGKGVMEIIGGI